MENTNKYSQYKGLSLGRVEPEEVKESEINEAIDNLLKREVSYLTKDEATEKGDTVNIDFEGFVDEVAFEGGKGNNYDLELGSNTFIPGFEDQLIGFKKGEDVEVNVTFPENYQAENLKGKRAVFKCKVNEVKTKVTPVLDDGFAKSFNFENVDTLKEAVKKEIAYNKKSEAENNFLAKICNYLADSSEIEVDEETKNKRLDEMVGYYANMVRQYGMDLDNYLKMSNLTKDEFKNRLLPDAIKSVKIDVVYDYIAKEENIVASDEQVEQELLQMKKMYNVGDEQLAQIKKEHLEDLRKDIVRREISALLLKENN